MKTPKKRLKKGYYKDFQMVIPFFQSSSLLKLTHSQVVKAPANDNRMHLPTNLDPKYPEDVNYSQTVLQSWRVSQATASLPIGKETQISTSEMNNSRMTVSKVMKPHKTKSTFTNKSTKTMELFKTKRSSQKRPDIKSVETVGDVTHSVMQNVQSLPQISSVVNYSSPSTLTYSTGDASYETNYSTALNPVTPTYEASNLTYFPVLNYTYDYQCPFYCLPQLNMQYENSSGNAEVSIQIQPYSPLTEQQVTLSNEMYTYNGCVMQNTSAAATVGESPAMTNGDYSSFISYPIYFYNPIYNNSGDGCIANIGCYPRHGQ